MNTPSEWIERIEFTYANSDGETITGAIEQLNGLQRERVREAFEDFMQLAGFAMPEDSLRHAVLLPELDGLCERMLNQREGY